MVSGTKHGIGGTRCHRLCHEKLLLGDTKICRTVPDTKQKKPAFLRACVCFGARSCQSMPDVESFPLDGARRLGGHVIDDAVDAFHLIDYARGGAAKELHVEMIEIGSHAVHGGHRA